MDFLLDSDDDWQEQLRRYLYPRLHPYLTTASEITNVPLFATKVSDEGRHAATLEVDPELFEETLVELGFIRNPVAAFKTLDDGTPSVGSWALLYEDDDDDLLDEGHQLHVVLFEVEDGLAIHAHAETDWRHSAIGHLRGDYFSRDDGIEGIRYLLDNYTYHDL